MTHNEHLSGLDLDWFVSDASGALFHFTSAGGYVPAFVPDDAATVAAQVLALPEVSPGMVLNPGLAQAAGLATEQDFRDYLVSSAEYARRGFFTYDKTSPYYQGSTYHLVASPLVRLRYSQLPASLQAHIRGVGKALLVSSLAPRELAVEALRVS